MVGEGGVEHCETFRWAFEVADLFLGFGSEEAGPGVQAFAFVEQAAAPADGDDSGEVSPPRSGVAVELGADEVEAAVDADHAGFEFKEVELGCDFGSPEEGIAVHIVEFVIGTDKGTGECGEDEIVVLGDEARPFDSPAASFDFDSDITRVRRFFTECRITDLESVRGFVNTASEEFDL